MGIFAGFDTDKANPHTYETVYVNLLSHRRESLHSVLELGINKGGSLLAWRDYFPNAEIVGVDNDFDTMMNGEERITTLCGDVGSSDTYTRVLDVLDKFDLVVDDASHRQIHQYFALVHLWDSVSIGGYYVIEDLDLDERFEVISGISEIVRGTGEITLHLGDGCPNDDMLIIERLS